MNTVTRGHLAGLELFAKIHGNDLDSMLCEDLDKLIAQASAAPEQEPVAWKYRERVYRTSLGMVWTDKIESEKPDPDELEVKDLQPLYAHANPSEVERLRADLDTMRRKNNEYCDDLIADRQKLAEAQALLRRCEADSQLWYEEFGEPSDGGYQAAFVEIDAFLSAPAQPAEPHDAETDDGSCPECEGACSDHCGPCRQCGGQGTFEAALIHAQPAEGQTNE